MAADQNEFTVLGRIGKTHGIKGWLKISAYTSAVENICEYRYFRAGTGKRRVELELTESRVQGNALIAHFQGYDDPEIAGTLSGLEIAVPRSELPELEAQEYYWHQLQGLEVYNLQGQNYGKVSRLLETGANDVLVVSPTENSIDKRERLIPYLFDTVVTKVDLDAARIEVDWEVDFLE